MRAYHDIYSLRANLCFRFKGSAYKTYSTQFQYHQAMANKKFLREPGVM